MKKAAIISLLLALLTVLAACSDSEAPKQTGGASALVNTASPD